MPVKFLTNYFGFTKQQRNGLFILICLSFLLLVVRLSYPYFIKPAPIQVLNLPLLERKTDSASEGKRQQSELKNKHVNKAKYLVEFDPNTINAEQMANLGFSEKTARVLINFRNKGFVFKQKTDLKKVYGISDDFYAELEPYIQLKNALPIINNKAVTEVKTSKPISVTVLQTKLELNSADSAALISVKGIGTTYAKRILKYRSLLGGYVSVLQLKEVYGFTDELYLQVKDNFTVNPLHVTKINLNSDAFKVINKHPYITYEICKTIFDWRKKTNITPVNLKDILQDELLYQKLMPYLLFE